MINVAKRSVASFFWASVNYLHPGPTARRVISSKLITFIKTGRTLAAKALLFWE